MKDADLGKQLCNLFNIVLGCHLLFLTYLYLQSKRLRAVFIELRRILMALTPRCCEKCTNISKLLLNPDSEFKMVKCHLNQNQGTMGFFPL